MISFLILFLMSTWASIDLSVAQKQWRGFRACVPPNRSAPSHSEELLSCAAPFLSKSLVAPEKARLVQFLDMEIPFSHLQECSENSPVLPARIRPKEKLFCLKIVGGKATSDGYVLFVEEADGIKIKSIKFKWLSATAYQ